MSLRSPLDKTSHLTTVRKKQKIEKGININLLIKELLIIGNNIQSIKYDLEELQKII